MSGLRFRASPEFTERLQQADPGATLKLRFKLRDDMEPFVFGGSIRGFTQNQGAPVTIGVSFEPSTTAKFDEQRDAMVLCLHGATRAAAAHAVASARAALNSAV